MIKTIISTVILLLIIIVATFAFLLTPPGLKAGLAISKRFLPGKLEYQSVSGVILGPINIRNIKYRFDNKLLTIHHLHLQWQLSSLFNKQIKIKSLKIDSVKLYSDAQQKTLSFEDAKKQFQQFIQNLEAQQRLSTTSAQLQEKASQFTLPLSVILKHAVISDFQYIGKQKQAILHLKNMNTHGIIESNNLKFTILANSIAPYVSQNTLNIAGSFSHYQINIASKSQYFNWHIKGSGTWQQINLTLIKSNTLGGILSGNTKVEWSPSIKWQANFTSSHLNPSLLNATWPKQLNISLHTQGKIQNQQPIFTLTSHLQTPNINLSLDAKHQKQWNIKWHLLMDQIKQYFPTYSGKMLSQGTLQGSLQAPTTRGNILISQLSMNGYQINQLKGQWNIDFSNKHQSNIDFTATDLLHNVIELSSAKIQASGKWNDNTIQGDIKSNGTNYSIRLKGGVTQNTWQGSITQLSISSKDFNHWNLTHPAKLAFSNQLVRLQQACLASKNHAKICMQINWNDDSTWNLSLNSNHFNLHALPFNFESELKFYGTANFNLEANGKNNQLQRANWNISLSPGKISYLLANKVIHQTYQSASIQGDYKNKTLQSELNINVDKIDKVTGNIRLLHYNGIGFPSGSLPIEGKLRAYVGNLKFLSAFLPEMIIPSGHFTADLTLAGTLHNPNLSGQANLSKSKIELPNLNVEFSQLKLHFSAKQKIIYFDASALSGKQTIHLKGNTNLSSPDLTTTATLTGNDILVSDTTEFKIYASPDLSFTVKGKQIQISGSITIPKGEIKPHNFQSVTALPHDDIVYVGPRKPVSKNDGFLISSKIALIINKDVQLKTAGITGNLSGKIDIVSLPKQTPLGTGTISIINGKFSNFATTLNIDPSSYISFTHSPLDNPYLYVRVSKTINLLSGVSIQEVAQQTYVVGLNIEGSFKHPKLSLYSIPAGLSESDIVSYLVLGKSLDVASNSKSSSENLSALGSALSTLGFGGDGTTTSSNPLTNIKNELGITQLGVQTQTAVDVFGNPLYQQTSFVIGKRITNRIFVSYSQGLSNTVGITNVDQFTATFLINKNWSLRTNSSNLGSGFDILYTVQKK